ncbi:Uncharacterised protein g850 [Pycnogonum litorale]
MEFTSFETNPGVTRKVNSVQLNPNPWNSDSDNTDMDSLSYAKLSKTVHRADAFLPCGSSLDADNVYGENDFSRFERNSSYLYKEPSGNSTVISPDETVARHCPVQDSCEKLLNQVTTEVKKTAARKPISAPKRVRRLKDRNQKQKNELNRIGWEVNHHISDIHRKCHQLWPTKSFCDKLSCNIQEVKVTRYDEEQPDLDVLQGIRRSLQQQLGNAKNNATPLTPSNANDRFTHNFDRFVAEDLTEDQTDHGSQNNGSEIEFLPQNHFKWQHVRRHNCSGDFRCLIDHQMFMNRQPETPEIIPGLMIFDSCYDDQDERGDLLTEYEERRVASCIGQDFGASFLLHGLSEE